MCYAKNMEMAMCQELYEKCPGGVVSNCSAKPRGGGARSGSVEQAEVGTRQAYVVVWTGERSGYGWQTWSFGHWRIVEGSAGWESRRSGRGRDSRERENCRGRAMVEIPESKHRRTPRKTGHEENRIPGRQQTEF